MVTIDREAAPATAAAAVPAVLAALAGRRGAALVRAPCRQCCSFSLPRPRPDRIRVDRTPCSPEGNKVMMRARPVRRLPGV